MIDLLKRLFGITKIESPSRLQDREDEDLAISLFSMLSVLAADAGGPDIKAEIKRIGEHLHAKGGAPRLQRVEHLVQQEGGDFLRLLRQEWGGIGSDPPLPPQTVRNLSENPSNPVRKEDLPVTREDRYRTAISNILDGENAFTKAYDCHLDTQKDLFQECAFVIGSPEFAGEPVDTKVQVYRVAGWVGLNTGEAPTDCERLFHDGVECLDPTERKYYPIHPAWFFLRLLILLIDKKYESAISLLDSEHKQDLIRIQLLDNTGRIFYDNSSLRNLIESSRALRMSFADVVARRTSGENTLDVRVSQLIDDIAKVRVVDTHS